MAYLIDTDVVSDHLAEDPRMMQLLDQLSGSGIAISMITYMEAFDGVLQSPDPIAAQARFDIFLADVPVIPFSDVIARRCAQLRNELRRQGKRIRPRVLDLIIAATALEHGLTLVTRNKADYDDIPNLTLL